MDELQALRPQDVDAVLPAQPPAHDVVKTVKGLDFKGVVSAVPQAHGLGPAVAVMAVAAQHRISLKVQLRIAAQLPVAIGVQGKAAGNELETGMAMPDNFHQKTSPGPTFTAARSHLKLKS